jgi:hypothetical protein
MLRIRNILEPHNIAMLPQRDGFAGIREDMA